jgi:choline dehydrogenase-like flavoprotein
MDYEFKTRTTYGNVDGANLLDWPVSLNEMEPYYDKAEKAIGSTHRHGRPPLPANNNYKVFANGAEILDTSFMQQAHMEQMQHLMMVVLDQFKMVLIFKEIKTHLNGVQQ